MTAVTGAGRSQAEEAQRARLRIAEYERLLRDEHDRLTHHELAGRTEKQVGARLAAMSIWGWHLLPDRRWPVRNSRANVDMLHIGPGGVLVVDVKAWRDPRIENGSLYRADEDATDEVDTLLRITELVEDAAAPIGLAQVQIQPVIVLAGRKLPATSIGRALVMGEQNVVSWANRRGARLNTDEVTTVAATLAETFPPYEVADAPVARVVVPDPVLPRQLSTQAEQLELLDLAELEQSLIELELAKPIEQWMTFLHPDQLAVVRRAANGPSRVRGPAGTGKTVVGLHRAAYLASTKPGRLLYVSYVRTLPVVLASHYTRLSPHTADRVEFVGLHAWALRFLRSRGVRVNLDGDRARQLFNRVWASVGRYSALTTLPVHPDYWYDEVVAVIKGRGLTSYSDYASLQRVGRRTPLQAEHRAAAWDLHRAYDVVLREVGIHDFSDVLALALAEVRAKPLDDPYAAVLIDEVQDLICIGVQLIHELGGDGFAGLHLIGDGQQSVYPGGYSLSEAGIDVRGRSTVLRTHYRNAAEVLATASALVAVDEFDDLEGAERGSVRLRSPGTAVRPSVWTRATSRPTTLPCCPLWSRSPPMARHTRRLRRPHDDDVSGARLPACAGQGWCAGPPSRGL